MTQCNESELQAAATMHGLALSVLERRLRAVDWYAHELEAVGAGREASHVKQVVFHWLRGGSPPTAFGRRGETRAALAVLRGELQNA